MTRDHVADSLLYARRAGKRWHAQIARSVAYYIAKEIARG